MLLPPPTWSTLMELERFTSVGAALEWSARRVIHRRQPEVLEGSSGDRIIVLPPAPRKAATTLRRLGSASSGAETGGIPSRASCEHAR